jgi:hypothetical protein
MNTRMEKLIPDAEYGNQPADSREPVDFEIAVAAIETALERILAEFNAQARKSGGAA